MPIVSVTLKNFRSYATETVDQFNPCLNVVLGRNGDGKSNLLRGNLSGNSALLFVLSDKVLFNETEKHNFLHVPSPFTQKGLADDAK